jgi:hypothetical protein
VLKPRPTNHSGITASQSTESGLLPGETGGERTGAPDRIRKLLETVWASGEASNAVPYQLLSALCGTALQAQKDRSSIDVFVVQEFHTSLTVKEKIRKNEQDFRRFTYALWYPNGGLVNEIIGPVHVAGRKCFVGKTVCSYENA